jgi:tetratricopeptide (TPR) repeat protein
VSSTTFKYRYVRDGNVSGLFSSKGELQEQALRLKDSVIPLHLIVETTTRDERLVVVLDTSRGEVPPDIAKQMTNNFIVLHIYGMKATALEKQIDRRTSVLEVERRKQALQQEGKPHLFRVATCPNCQATVDLSELPEAPYSYCRFCESVFGSKVRTAKASSEYRECDECGYYDRIQGYGEFYFYFLLVVYGFRHRRRHLCDDCGASLANKLLAINAIFLLGVPNAVICAIRARAGRDADLSPLSTANRLAKKGRVGDAQQHYDKILHNLPGHPGIHYNMTLANLQAQQGAEAMRQLQAALTQCPNYEPALRIAARMAGS